MTAVTPLPGMPRRMDRVMQQQREANIAKDLTDARAMMRHPNFYSNAELRWACSILETYGDGMDWQLADQMIHALNLRERQDAHATVRRQFVDHYDPDRERPEDHGLALIIAVLAVAGLAAVAFGWVLQQGWLG